MLISNFIPNGKECFLCVYHLLKGKKYAENISILSKLRSPPQNTLYINLK